MHAPQSSPTTGLAYRSDRTDIEPSNKRRSSIRAMAQKQFDQQGLAKR